MERKLAQAGDIQDYLYLDMLNDNECVLKGFLYQDNIPTLEENYVQKMNANNGFSEKRMFRKIASIPILDWINCMKEGRDMDNPKEVYKYLKENPDYMTVERIDSMRDPRIRVY